jgi:tRNA(Ile2) C34 agmatinyltransferase TiaS
MILYIGIDDTDLIGTPGTGHIARTLASQLAARFSLLGVTRHQLLEDPRVPCTKKNSCAGIILEMPDDFELDQLYADVAKYVTTASAPGSDPGLCMATSVSADIIEFGLKTQRTLVTQTEARELAHFHNIMLSGLGGNEDGIIGALSSVGLNAEGNDGRYVMVGSSRALQGLQPVSSVIAAGITAVQTVDGTQVDEGFVQTDQLRPARRNGRPVAIVEWTGNFWTPLKLN